MYVIHRHNLWSKDFGEDHSWKGREWIKTYKDWGNDRFAMQLFLVLPTCHNAT
jgi:hypothetical protein